MHKTRSKLLITLVLVGVFSAALANAQTAGSVRFGHMPADPVGKSAFNPGATTNGSGEPDVGQGSPAPTRMAARQIVRAGESAIQPKSPAVMPLGDALRWAWVIWMARYLNQAP